MDLNWPILCGSASLGLYILNLNNKNNSKYTTLTLSQSTNQIKTTNYDHIGWQFMRWTTNCNSCSYADLFKLCLSGILLVEVGHWADAQLHHFQCIHQSGNNSGGLAMWLYQFDSGSGFQSLDRSNRNFRDWTFNVSNHRLAQLIIHPISRSLL